MASPERSRPGTPGTPGTPGLRPRSSTVAATEPSIRVRDPGELVAAVPVLLGFHPRDSLVMIAIGGPSGRRLGLIVRMDLPPPEHAEAAVSSAVDALLPDAPAGAAVIVVCAAGGERGGRPAAMAVAGLERAHVEAQAVLWAESTAAGAPWACYDPCGCTGLVPDPASTPLAAAAVAGGQVVHADRADLERLVAPADAGRIRCREVLLTRAVDEAVGPPAGPPAGPAAGLRLVDAAIAGAARGGLVLDDRAVVDLAGALADPVVRDAALLRCTGAAAAAAEQLWTALVRETPDPEAAEPAALLAVSALLRGDGALANVALDRAQRAWPGHRLAGLLRSVADAGMRPDQVRACLRGTPAAGGLRRAGRVG